MAGLPWVNRQFGFFILPWRIEMIPKKDGFSLFELLTVLAIIAVVSTIVAPHVLSWQSSAKLRGAADNVRGDLEMSKAKAVRERSPVTVTFTSTNYQITFTDSDGNARTLRNRQLPAGVRVDLDDTSFGTMDDETQFNGRGFPVAGSAVLVNKKGEQKRIIVSTLGRIRIE
jgi:type IV fimbrial biogenesis protein FimT